MNNYNLRSDNGTVKKNGGGRERREKQGRRLLGY